MADEDDEIWMETKKSQFGQAPPPFSLERSYSSHSTEEPGCSLPSSPKASSICWSSNTSAMTYSQCATPDAWHEGVLEESRLQCPAWPARTSRKNCNWSCYESYSSANNRPDSETMRMMLERTSVSNREDGWVSEIASKGGVETTENTHSKQKNTKQIEKLELGNLQLTNVSYTINIGFVVSEVRTWKTQKIFGNQSYAFFLQFRAWGGWEQLQENTNTSNIWINKS